MSAFFFFSLLFDCSFAVLSSMLFTNFRFCFFLPFVDMFVSSCVCSTDGSLSELSIIILLKSPLDSSISAFQFSSNCTMLASSVFASSNVPGCKHLAIYSTCLNCLFSCKVTLYSWSDINYFYSLMLTDSKFS